MNIFFVTYNNYDSNSTIHVHGFAKALQDRGHNVVVCIPDGIETIITFREEIKYQVVTYEESLLEYMSIVPDIIHAWTPREIVRKHVSKLHDKYLNAKIVIHLEDNEEHIIETCLEKAYSQIENYSETELNDLIPSNLSHPKRIKEFLSQANGITYIIDKLKEFIPENKKSHMLWPIILPELFQSQNGHKLRKKLNINDNETLISYTGNVHKMNYKEVRSLYLAIAIANRENIPCRLIRTGIDHFNYLGNNPDWANKNSINLGFVDYHKIPEINSAADILIQPGKPDQFNNYRLPSKIPEFLASGKPVVLPNTNIACYLQKNLNAIFLENGNAIEIFNILVDFKNNREKYLKIGLNGLDFCKSKFNSDSITRNLLDFYATL